MVKPTLRRNPKPRHIEKTHGKNGFKSQGVPNKSENDPRVAKP